MTFSVRLRLTIVSTAVFGLLLAAFGLITYRVLAHQLNADATAIAAELTSGLHGYLRIDAGTPTLAFDESDPQQGHVRRTCDPALPGRRTRRDRRDRRPRRGIGEASASISKLFSGWLSDRLRRRKALTVVAYALGALSKPLFAVAPESGVGPRGTLLRSHRQRDPRRST